MPMGIGPGLSVTRFESGIPGWMTGMDLGWDFTQNVQYSGATNPTDTHSATIYAQSAAGVWSPFAANTLVRTDLGMQTVPTRTNSLRNNSMSGAVAGSPGTLPTNWAGTQCALQVVELGTLNGINYIDLRATRTNSSGGNEFPQIFFEGVSGGAAASVGQVWTASSWAQVLSGSAPSTSLSLREQVIGSYLANSEVTFGSTFVRATLTRTFNQPTVNQANASISFGLLPNGQSLDVTIRIGWPQLELGAFASAPILTTSGAATVNGNQQVVDLTGRLGSGVGIIMQFNAYDVTAAFKIPFMFNDGSGNNSFIAYTNNGSGQSFTQIYTSGMNQGTVTLPGTPAVGVQTWVAVAGPNYHRSQKIGQSAGTADTTVTWPTMTRLAIGGNGYVTNDNMYQNAMRMALRFGPANDAMFNDLVAKATILNAVS